MKKILILALAAVSCFCSCMMESHEDYIYTISLGLNDRNKIITSLDPEGIDLINEFDDAIESIRSTNKGNWVWVETIDNGHFSKADAAALKKYDAYKAEVQSLIDKYQAKFDAIPYDPDKGSAYEVSYTLLLYRSMESDNTLASTDFKISYTNGRYAN